MVCSSHGPQPAARQGVLELSGGEASLRGAMWGSTVQLCRYWWAVRSHGGSYVGTAMRSSGGCWQPCRHHSSTAALSSNHSVNSQKDRTVAHSQSSQGLVSVHQATVLMRIKHVAARLQAKGVYSVASTVCSASE